MKNIHVLQKNIFNQLGVDHYGKTPTQIKIAEFLINKNIYITSNEEIKERDYGLDTFHKEIRKFRNKNFVSKYDKKIILTTDQDLIKDGVQTIDDEFLVWLVKNPSCERVEVEIKPMFPMYSTFIESIDNPPFYGNLKRKIIIPQEEPKQETLEEAAELYEKTRVAHDELYVESNDIEDLKASYYYKGRRDECIKWQSKRMYSEEEVEQIFNIGQMIKNYGDYKPYTFKEALEQFKKK
jgi:hypothetical protein